MIIQIIKDIKFYIKKIHSIGFILFIYIFLSTFWHNFSYYIYIMLYNIYNGYYYLNYIINNSI